MIKFARNKFIFGIRITINYNDHVPSHLHAEYNGDKALVDIINVKVLKGMLPKRQLKLVFTQEYQVSIEKCNNLRSCL